MSLTSCTSSSAFEYPFTASPTNVPLPNPPIAVGAVHTHQSVAVFMSSICVAAVAAPKRNPPLPASPASGPIVPNMMGSVGGASSPHAQRRHTPTRSARMGEHPNQNAQLDTRDRVPILAPFAMVKDASPFTVL